MPATPGRPAHATPVERKFAEVYAATKDAKYAAKEAGWAAPASSGPRALQRPAVQIEIRRVEETRLTVEGLPLAVDTVLEIMRDKTHNPRNRLTAAKMVFDRTLGSADAGGAKDPHEMTAGEIAARLVELRAMQSELAGLAIDVTPADDQIEEPEPEPFG